MSPASPLTDLVIASARQEIVFILDDVPDFGQLAATLGASREVVVLSAAGDGLAQIAQALQGRSGIDALHVISHGSADGVALGTLTLGSAEVAQRQPELAVIGRSLAPDADVLLYGCDAGASAGLAGALAIATGADVALSDDRTGHASLGGDWELEVTSGSVETAPLVDAQLAASWQEVLAIGSASITFDNLGNFANQGQAYDATQNAVYNVNGNSAYRLEIDGAQLGSATYAGFPKVYLGSRDGVAAESSVTLSFQGGQVFTAGSLKFFNWAEYMPVDSTTQTFVVRGYASDGLQVGSAQTITLPASNAGTLSFSGMTDVQTLKITSTTNGGNLVYFAIDDFAISNVHPAPPAVTFLSSPAANGTYKIGDTIQVAVAFDQAVFVTGTPLLTLETGTTDRAIQYSGGSGTSVLTFTYTVQAGDQASDLDVLSAAALSLDGGTIQSAGGTAADLALPAPGTAGSLGANEQLVIDGIAPTVLGIGASDTALKAGETATITFTFSEDPGASFTLADLQVSGGTLSGLAGTGTVRTAVFTPTAGVNGGTGLVTLPIGSFTDAAGNASSGGAGIAIAFDTLAPAAPSAPDLQAASDSGTSATDNLTNDTTPTFRGTAEAGATVTLYDSDGTTVLGSTTADGSGNWTVTSSVLGAGTHTVTARAVDAAGNAGSVSAGLAVTIDAAAPAAPGRPDLAASSDTGTSATDNVTADATPTFAGTAEAGATVRLYASDGTTVIGTTVAGIDGAWSLAVALEDGTHALTVRAEDAAGNLGPASPALTVVVDTQAPTNTVAGVLLSADTGASATDFVTRTAAQTISGTLSANLAAGEFVQVSLDNGGTWSLADAGTGSSTWSFDATLAGADTLQVRVVDAAGNAGSSTAQAYMLDTTAPAAGSTPDLQAGSDTGASSTDNITADATPTFTGTAQAGALVTLYDENDTVLGQAVATGGTWSITSSALDEGTHLLRTRVTDLAGNVSAASGDLAVLVDLSAPATTVTGASLSDDTGRSAGDFVTRTAAQVISGTLSAPLAAGESVQVSLDDGATWSTASASAGDSSWSFDATLGGSGTLLVRVMDALDRAGVAWSQDVVLDTGAPAAPPAPSLAASSDTGGSSSDRLTSDRSPTVTGTAEAGAAVVLYDTDGSTVLGSTIADAEGQWAIASTPLPDGEHRLTAVATDVAGNSSATSAPLDVTIDGAAPTVRVVAALAQDRVYHQGDVIVITVRFTEPVTVEGTPTLALETGAIDGVATYAGGSGRAALTFHYTVQAGDRSADLDYLSTGALQLDGGSIRDAAGNDAVLALPQPGAAGSLSSSEDIAIDGVAPTLVATRVNGDVLVLRYREALDGSKLPVPSDFTVHAGRTEIGVDSVHLRSDVNAIVLRLDASVAPGQAVTVDYRDPPGDHSRAIQDLAGNDAESLVNLAVRNITVEPAAVHLVGLAADAAGPAWI